MVLPSQDPLHHQTHHEIPRRHSLTLAREPLVSDAVPPSNCPDLFPSAGQTDYRTAVTAGLSWLLGADGSQILFPAQYLPSPHHLCCLPVQPTHCLCNPATDNSLLPVMQPQGTLRTPQHAPSLWQKVSYKGMARPTQTDKQGLRGSTHLPFTVQAPAGPESTKKQRKARVNGVAGVQSHSQCLCPPSEVAKALGSPLLPEQPLALLALRAVTSTSWSPGTPGKAAPASAATVAQGLGNRSPQSRTCHLSYILVASMQFLRGSTGFPAHVHWGRGPFEPRSWSTMQCHHQTFSSHHLNCLNTADRGAGMLETDPPIPAWWLPQPEPQT